MTNPNNMVRVRARNGGRASVYEANGWAQGFTSGLLEGNGVTQNTSADMNVLVGGHTNKPDVILAENTEGYRIALDIVSKQAVAVTAPATNSRISAIVAYTDDLSLATTEDTVTGSPASCGLIVVNGSAAANPTPPNDTQIRSAITADGATGSQAAYCVIATILIPSGTTMVTDNMITINACKLAQQKVVASDNIDFETIIPAATGVEINTGMEFGGKTVYAQRFVGDIPITAFNTQSLVLIESGIDSVIKAIGWGKPGATFAKSPTGTIFIGGGGESIFVNGGHYVLVTNNNELQYRVVYITSGNFYYDFVCYYTKL